MIIWYQTEKRKEKYAVINISNIDELFSHIDSFICASSTTNAFMKDYSIKFPSRSVQYIVI